MIAAGSRTANRARRERPVTTRSRKTPLAPIAGAGLGADQDRGQHAEEQPERADAVLEAVHAPGGLVARRIRGVLDRTDAEEEDHHPDRQEQGEGHHPPIAAELEDLGADHLACDRTVHDWSPNVDVSSRNRSSSEWRTGSRRDTATPACTSAVFTAAAPSSSTSVTRIPSTPGATAATAGWPRAAPAPGRADRSRSRARPPPPDAAAPRSAPASTIRPRSITAAASHVFSTSSSRCEERNTVRPSSTSSSGSCGAARGCRPGPGRSSARRGSAARDRRAGSGRRRAAGAFPASTCSPARWRGRRGRRGARAAVDPAHRLRAADGGRDLEVLATGQVAVEMRLLDDRADPGEDRGALLRGPAGRRSPSSRHRRGSGRAAS